MNKKMNDKRHNPNGKKERKIKRMFYYQIINHFQPKGIIFTEF